ncbi:MAG: hypothetical protein GF329_10150 [Candidatus Lokiarchaeota archaeon]|nr:hypothetical protein [Candidatus Lokiarchaeota archaeon]
MVKIHNICRYVCSSSSYCGAFCLFRATLEYSAATILDFNAIITNLGRYNNMKKKFNIFFLLFVLFLPTILIVAPLISDNDTKSSISITVEVSALPTDVVINEVYFDDNLDDAAESGEFVELYNPTDHSIDLSSYRITDEETPGGGEGTFEFPSGSVMPSRGFFVIFKSIQPGQLIQPEDVSNTSLVQLFETIAPTSTDNDTRVADCLKIAGTSGNMWLANGGDGVYLKTPTDVVVDSVSFGSSPEGALAFVPTPGDWEGYSFERQWTSVSAFWHVDTNGDGVKKNPSPGHLQGETPEFGDEDPFGGGIPETPVINEVYFGELMTSGSSQYNQYIEIFNPTDKNWNLTGWKIETSLDTWTFNRSKWADELGDSDILLIWPDNDQSLPEDDQWPWAPTDDEAPWYEFWNNVDDMETWYPGDGFTHPEHNDYTNHELVGTTDLNLDKDGDYVAMKNTSDDVIDAVAWGTVSLPSEVSAVIGDQNVGKNHGISQNESLERIWQKTYPVCAFLAGPGVFHEPTPGWKVGEVPDEIQEQSVFDITAEAGESIDGGSSVDGIEIDGGTASQKIVITCEKLEKNPKDDEPNGIPAGLASGVDDAGLEFWHIQANGTVDPITITVHMNNYVVNTSTVEMFEWDHQNHNWKNLNGVVDNSSFYASVTGITAIDASVSEQMWIGVWGEVTSSDDIPGFEWLFIIVAIVSIGYLWVIYKKRRL